MDYNPNDVGQKGSLFGMPFNEENSELIVIPVPWEVTVSYKDGTAKGPNAIINASTQIDFYNDFYTNKWEKGICVDSSLEKVFFKNDGLRENARKYIEFVENGGIVMTDAEMQSIVKDINGECVKLNFQMFSLAKQLLNKDKKVAILGGDHSVSLGLVQALSEKYESFGILQFDAHADLRKAYQGFEYSHASTMFNMLDNPQVESLTQVGIRDYCEDEVNLIMSSNGKINTFYDSKMKELMFKGETWDSICQNIVSMLPDNIYISFDIDGLSPELCPSTGTPVPGGLSYEQVEYLLKQINLANKNIIGFDLCEVAPGSKEWDESVGARLLFLLSSCALYKD